MRPHATPEPAAPPTERSTSRRNPAANPHPLARVRARPSSDATPSLAAARACAVGVGVAHTQSLAIRPWVRAAEDRATVAALQSSGPITERGPAFRASTPSREHPLDARGAQAREKQGRTHAARAPPRPPREGQPQAATQTNDHDATVSRLRPRASHAVQGHPPQHALPIAKLGAPPRQAPAARVGLHQTLATRRETIHPTRHACTPRQPHTTPAHPAVTAGRTRAQGAGGSGRRLPSLGITR